MICLIVAKNDKLSNKACEVNSRLVHICAERNIPYIDHSIHPKNHLSESKLQFNRHETMVFSSSTSKLLSECC